MLASLYSYKASKVSVPMGIGIKFQVDANLKPEI
jgi:hypothetical protein